MATEFGMKIASQTDIKHSYRVDIVDHRLMYGVTERKRPRYN
jgi:hypothetical protein